MIETYRMLGAQREAELLNEARRLRMGRLVPRKPTKLGGLFVTIRAARTTFAQRTRPSQSTS